MPPIKINLKNRMLNRTKARTNVWTVCIYFGDLVAVDFSPLLPTIGSPSTGYGCSDCTGLSVFHHVHKGRRGGCWKPGGQDDGVWEFPECLSPHSNHSPRQGIAQETFTLRQVRCLSESIGPVWARMQLNSSNQFDWTAWRVLSNVLDLGESHLQCGAPPGLCLPRGLTILSPSYPVHCSPSMTRTPPRWSLNLFLKKLLLRLNDLTNLHQPWIINPFWIPRTWGLGNPLSWATGKRWIDTLNQLSFMPLIYHIIWFP